MSVATVSYLFDKPEEMMVNAVEHKKRNTKAIGDLSELEMAWRSRARAIQSQSRSEIRIATISLSTMASGSPGVQVKTGRLRKGFVSFNCYSSHTHRGGAASRPYFGEVEYIAVWCPQTGTAYLVPEAHLVRTKMHLRVDPTVNRQDRHIRWADRHALP
jgi:hypothetical protein